MERFSTIFSGALFAALLIGTGVAAAAAAGTGATLRWSAPTVNADGSKISDLIGFNVYHGTSPTSMLLAASVTAGTTQFAEPNLTPSLWYWYVTAVNSQGIESEPSIIVSKLIVATSGDPTNGGNVPGGSSNSSGTGGSAQNPPHWANSARIKRLSTHCAPVGRAWCSR